MARRLESGGVVVVGILLAAMGAAEEPAPPQPVKISWSDGKTTLETDRFAVNLSNRLQLRFGDEIPDDANQLPGTEGKGDAKASFRFARVRTKLDGWVYRKWFQYDVQLDWADATGIVQDLDLNWDVSHQSAFQVKLGQFKIPFGRQALSSAMYQEFVDRSIVSTEYEKIRDQGLQVWGTLAHAKVEYRAGVFNGAGRQRTLGTPSTGNDNTKFQYDARLMVQPFGGDVKYSEGDFESKDRPLLAVAVNVEENDARVPVATGASPTPAPTFKRAVVGGDVSFKFRGVALMAEYFDRTLTPLTGASFKSNGYHVQAGYFVKRDTVELAARYASWDPTNAASGNDRTELGGAVSYFYSKHNLKAVADYRRLQDKAKDTSDKELRFQAQLVF